MDKKIIDFIKYLRNQADEYANYNDDDYYLGLSDAYSVIANNLEKTIVNKETYYF
ncbi:MAG: hypothetical protein K0Q49_1971 [Haloplasmataceae bacterium]|jgi:hypothetical protein|nr:hypothetical protein [Haloplasmataceae bacterium]